MDIIMEEKKVVDDDGWNQHGLPRGYHFVPDDLELIGFLREKDAGRDLPFPLPNIFHDVRIREHNPADLYEKYKRDAEAGSVYFFDHRGTGDGKHKKPVRAAKDGTWKASGGGKPLTTQKHGGLLVGHRLTLVFYQDIVGEKDRDKTNLAIKEYTAIGTHDEDLALYRLYKMKEGKGKGKTNAGQGASKTKKDKGKKKSTSSITVTPKVEELPSPGPPPQQQKVVDHSEHVDWGNMALDLPTSQQQATEHFGYPETDEQPLKMLPPSPLPAATAAEGYMADEFMVWCQAKQQQPEQELEAANPWLPITDEDLITDLPMLTDLDLPMLTEADDLYTFTWDELFSGTQEQPLPEEQVYSSSNQQQQF